MKTSLSNINRLGSPNGTDVRIFSEKSENKTTEEAKSFESAGVSEQN